MKRLVGAIIAAVMVIVLAFQPGVSSVRAGIPAYLNPALSPEDRADDLLAQMTLDEKIGQMTQVEKNSIKLGDISALFIGSILSGGGGSPRPNTPDAWLEMVREFQAQAAQTRLKIPLIYGVDAVHGHNNVYGAVIFPHNVGLGATRDADLVERIGRATADDLLGTGITWNFAPVVAVVQDYRWGRSYEGFGENTDLVTELGTAYLRGLQGDPAKGIRVLGTPKHFIGDGGTVWGTSQTYPMDQGDTQMDEATLRRLFLPPYEDAVKNGALSIMASFSSWNGLKMHAQKALLTDLLKGELGFKGFVVSDWAGIDQVDSDYYTAVVASINAGVDMNMVPYDYVRFIDAMKKAVDAGDISMERIDDAVRRILVAKFALGLFERPVGEEDLLAKVGGEESRILAREAVSKSLVLLKNTNQVLPLAKTTPTIYVSGAGAKSIGLQSGGWTITWQGDSSANLTPGVTILEGIENAVSGAKVVYDPAAMFKDEVDASGNPVIADVGVMVMSEMPYAEGQGDNKAPAVSGREVRIFNNLRERVKTLVVVIVSGRPVDISAILDQSDAVVAAWLPGTEGDGVTDVLFGDKPFTGKLPYTWLRSADQLPFDFESLPAEGCDAPLFPYGYGLSVSDTGSEWLDLAAECSGGTPVAVAPATATPAPVVALIAPEGTPRETYIAPFPVSIKLDGDLGDWAGVPRVTMSADVGMPSVTFAAAADDTYLYFMGEVQDDKIISGEHGADYWNEDSIEFYLNATGDLTLTSYTKGVAQMTFPPMNADSSPEAAVVAGMQGPSANPKVVTVRTASGYVVEVAVPLVQDVWTIKPADGGVLGFQVHLNASESGDRDTKLIWSALDTADASYQNPSLFGELIFHQVVK